MRFSHINTYLHETNILTTFRNVNIKNNHVLKGDCLSLEAHFYLEIKKHQFI